MSNTNRVEEFWTELQNLYEELLEDYNGKQPRVLGKVEEARQLLSEDDEIGKWETESLNYAEAAGNANWLRVAVLKVIEAIDVSQLPQDEYEWGFNIREREKTPTD